MSHEGYERVQALIQFALKRSVALLVENNDGETECATGTLLKIRDRHFIITAQHVFDNVDRETFRMLPSGKTTDEIPMGEYTLVTPKDRPDIDVAAIELSARTVTSLIARGSLFCSEHKVDLRGPAEPTYIIGFPAKSHIAPENFIVKPLTFQGRFRDPPASLQQPPITGVDFFYEHARHVYRNLDEDVSRSPEFHGVSGASAWFLIKPREEFSADECALIGGIQVACDFGSYIRVQSWRAVATLLGMHDIELAKALAEPTPYSVEDILGRPS
jgi:hypothetical protein